MWTKLKQCRKGDLIKAVFLGNPDPADSRDKNWHQIYDLNADSGGRYYVAVEGWGSGKMDGNEEVFKQ